MTLWFCPMRKIGKIWKLAVFHYAKTVSLIFSALWSERSQQNIRANITRSQQGTSNPLDQQKKTFRKDHFCLHMDKYCISKNTKDFIRPTSSSNNLLTIKSWSADQINQSFTAWMDWRSSMSILVNNSVVVWWKVWKTEPVNIYSTAGQ